MKPGIRETWIELLPMLKGTALALPLAVGFAALMVFIVLPWIWPELAYARCIEIGGDIYCW